MNDAHVVARELAAAIKAFGPAFETKVLEGVGLKLKPEIAGAVRSDIGDQSMSGWRRGRPVAIDGRYDLKDGQLVMSPARRAGGPMRVLEDGRGAGTGRRGRRHGATRGKGTWTDAERRMEKAAPPLVEKAVLDAVGKVLRG